MNGGCTDKGETNNTIGNLYLRGESPMVQAAATIVVEAAICWPHPRNYAYTRVFVFLLTYFSNRCVLHILL
jgi:hypothetical protein